MTPDYAQIFNSSSKERIRNIFNTTRLYDFLKAVLGSSSEHPLLILVFDNPRKILLSAGMTL